ncbi:AAA family ATPase [Streptomyces deccanensis]|uniref:AAA family ATPase n=1 Tax=Streptomyces deccanensis TaxID=424188 RepID=UPI001EFAF698|nr:AAA family ATPase [Streptomyces deccanensis]ULR51017.1 AAA family ATPase [Streptomyces deccanensis]
MHDSTARADGKGNDELGDGYDPSGDVHMIPDDRKKGGFLLVSREDIEAAHEAALEIEADWAREEQESLEFNARVEQYKKDLASFPPSEDDIKLANALRRAGYLSDTEVDPQGRGVVLWPPPAFEIEAAAAAHSRDRMGGDGSDEDEPAKLGVGQFADDPSRYLFYKGRDNSVFGPWDSGKTWLLIAVAAEFVRQGQHVVFLNFEQNTVADLKGRMRKVGVTKAWVEAFFHVYDHPDEAPEVSEPVALVVLDALNPAINHVGKNTNDSAGPNLVYRTYLRPLRDANPQMTSVILDHPNKDNDKSEGGTGRKGEITQAVKYRMANTERSRVGTRGYSTLFLVKDNTGEVDAEKGDPVAYVVRDSSQDRDAITVQILSQEPNKKGETATEGNERRSVREIAESVLRLQGPLTDQQWISLTKEEVRAAYPGWDDRQVSKNAGQGRYETRQNDKAQKNDDGLWEYAP